jgi:hypothetical protein
MVSCYGKFRTITDVRARKAPRAGDGGFQGAMGGRQMMALAPPIRWRHSHRPRFNLKLTDQHKQQIMDAVLRNAKVQE